METFITHYCSFSHDAELFVEREIRQQSPSESIAELTRNAVCGTVFRDENDRVRYVGVFKKSEN